MKLFNLHNIRLVLMLFGLLILLSFANKRHHHKALKSVEVEFLDASKLFITELEVEQLLKENLADIQDSILNEANLKRFENALNTNEMIKATEVFYDLNGKLTASVVQREPIARVFDQDFFYLDEEGFAMPLSQNYSARVPMVSGVSAENLKEIYPLLLKIREDDFLKKHIIAIRKKLANNYILEVRDKDFVVNFGQISYLDRKLKNYKVFYHKSLEYKKLDSYKRIDLQFGNQVVCTKK
ncbi:MAG: cell division protein FtsQ/DivIB [Psychroflexus sp.]